LVGYWCCCFSRLFFSFFFLVFVCFAVSTFAFYSCIFFNCILEKYVYFPLVRKKSLKFVFFRFNFLLMTYPKYFALLWQKSHKSFFFCKFRSTFLVTDLHVPEFFCPLVIKKSQEFFFCKFRSVFLLTYMKFVVLLWQKSHNYSSFSLSVGQHFLFVTHPKFFVLLW
jgi:hypothetical protein